MSRRKRLSHLALSLVLIYHPSCTHSQDQQLLDTEVQFLDVPPPVLETRFLERLAADSTRRALESTVLTSYTPTGIAYPSTKYTYYGLLAAVRDMAVRGIASDGRTFRFYTANRFDYGGANLALFLAMAMTESIAYDACDEFNTDAVAGRFAISNSCGQNNRSYQDEACATSEAHMSCPVDTEMVMVSSGYATGMMGRAPPPFSCRPKASSNDYAGYWEMRKGASEGTAYSNARGRSDTEGCCWWGRGALLTRGVCNIGKLNYYLGSKAAERGEGKFSTDFCANPESTCAGTEEMRWITAFFEWVERIQNYPGGWNYIDNLRQFVDQGMEDEALIDTVSSIFTRGCHSPECSALDIPMKEERKDNFKVVLDLLGLPLTTESPTRSPTQSPTQSPTPKPSSPQPTSVSPSPSMSVPQKNNSDTKTTMLTAMGPAPQLAPALPSSQSAPPNPTHDPNTKPTVPAPAPQNNSNTTPTMPNENTATGSTPLAPATARPTRNEVGNTPETELIIPEDNLAPVLSISWWTVLSLTIFICAFCL